MNQPGANKSSMPNSPPSLFYGRYQKVWLALLLVLVVGYHFGRPTLERWTGRDLPDLFSNDDSQVESGSDSGTPKTSSSAKSPEGAKSQKAEPDGGVFQLKKIGRDEFESPAGLRFGMGPNNESRVDHVLRHGEDQPDRQGSHGVFNGDRDEILSLLDEAYTLIKQKSKNVRTQDSSEYEGRQEHIVDFKRPIGYQGGQAGRKNNHPKLSKVKMILQDGNRVITAYPY